MNNHDMGNTKIITFTNLKGGTGKSMVCFNVAGFLAEMGNKVLVVDFDLQANMTHRCNVKNNNSIYTIKEILEDKTTDPSEVIVKGPINELPTLDIIPSNFYFTFTEMRIISYPNREKLFQNHIKSHKDIYDQYDYILIDTNPSFNVISINALVVSDAVFMVNDIDIEALGGSKIMMQRWLELATELELENNIKGFIINKYDKRNSLSDQFFEACKQTPFIQDILFETVIPVNVSLVKGVAYKLPINIFSKRTSGNKAFKELTKEIIERVNPEDE
ncbi:chromosome partitioning protein [Peptoclostridium litorale DSM 5388]|uniref:Chromosome partitioning protein ParA n=1 Tax=Peptoclostridium litorale DSM 5388 TaxID=1121324 RepID=A0A069RIG6_PEPLI|nr:ParA family protein [Peptoclostridium litorale]KDR96819.1 chromosome partitioning protein ParA [Peptoclostridium litorale DSM 5388]SIO36535.1 chromosome partitioning protein [Peptoclostridium litorale DSM 5388]